MPRSVSLAGGRNGLIGRTKPESVREGLQASKTVTCIALHGRRIGLGLICIQTWNLTWWVRTVGQNAGASCASELDVDRMGHHKNWPWVGNSAVPASKASTMVSGSDVGVEGRLCSHWRHHRSQH